LNIIKNSVNILITLINDLLDLSKIECCKLTIESNPFKIKEVIKNVYELLKIKANEKGLKLNIDIDNRIQGYVNGDKLRLNQILTNLIGNAIKFTNEGSICLSANILKESEKDIEIEFKIKDTGIGIKQDRLEKIFHRFEQG